jgi:hypothetical protein
MGLLEAGPLRCCMPGRLLRWMASDTSSILMDLCPGFVAAEAACTCNATPLRRLAIHLKDSH